MFPHLDKRWSTYVQTVARRTKSDRGNQFVVENVDIVSCTRSGPEGWSRWKLGSAPFLRTDIGRRLS